jgi:hypothetical protein
LIGWKLRLGLVIGLANLFVRLASAPVADHDGDRI